MAMNMRKAFSSRFNSPVTWYNLHKGHYDEYNNWIEGGQDTYEIRAVVREGNRQTQMDDGIGLKPTDGGERYGDYMTMYVLNKYPLQVKDKMKYKDKYYNIIRMSDMDTYGYRSYLMEKTKTWSPL